MDGCSVHGYSSDISRTIVFGAEPTKRQPGHMESENNRRAAALLRSSLDRRGENAPDGCPKSIDRRGSGPVVIYCPVYHTAPVMVSGWMDMSGAIWLKAQAIVAGGHVFQRGSRPLLSPVNLVRPGRLCLYGDGVRWFRAELLLFHNHLQDLAVLSFKNDINYFTKLLCAMILIVPDYWFLLKRART